MIKLDLVHVVVERTGLSKVQAEAAVQAIFGRMKAALEQGERIELRGFGVFSIRPRKTGVGRNPRTGAEVAITPGKSVRFRPGKEMSAID
ncbi:MAG: HU family DNA-binding protein [Terriglobales bacterium]